MKLLVVDGNSILNRAYYGIKLLTTKDGKYTNGIYGFLTMLNRIKDATEPDAVAIAFDLKAPTFRHKAYSGYKANRKGMPQELAQQLSPLKELLRYLGYKLVECEGYEADDILGTLAAECERTGNTCVIATGDRDSLQLVSEDVNVMLAKTNESILYDIAKIAEVYGVTPHQLIDIKAIQGDSSDNIPGVAGIGEKGARELITKFHDLDYIYENLDTIDIKPAMRNKLINGKESAYMSRMLGEICRTAPINTDINEYIPAPIDNNNAVRMMISLEFFSLIDKMGLQHVESNAQISNDEEKKEVTFTISDKTDANNIYEYLKEKKITAFSAQIKDGEFVQIAIACGDRVFNLYSINGAFNELLSLYFADNDIIKQTHDAKPIFAALIRQNIRCDKIDFDCALAAYLLNPSASGYELQRLMEEYSVAAANIETDDAIIKNAADTLALADELKGKLEANSQMSLLTDIEIPLAQVLASMEVLGFEVKAEDIRSYGEALQHKLDRLQGEIYDLCGCEFNINSPKQLGVVLFETLKLPSGKKTKSGYSTSAEVLEQLRHEHPVVEKVLEYRTVAKLKSTYCDGLLKVISSDGRIHSSFNQTETRTGRISSTEPNLQNIPVRTELGKEFRKFFTAKDGCVLVDADYSQIELRVLAHIANDKNMIDAFNSGDDIHAITASQVFKMPLEMITPIMRSRAKAVNFGIVYGIGAFSLSKDIGVTRKEASNYINNYLAHYSGVDKYMANVVEEAKNKGYVETMFNRRRYLPELASSNHNLRAFGERVARNMPIQGTAADIIKIAMVRVYRRLKEEKMSAHLILQVHDELIVEAPVSEADRVKKILEQEMSGAVDMAVPLIADAAYGKTWYEAKA
ncbi:MAG: DNA polymerase I [Acutalibacteraceae bacterium]